MTTKSLAYAAYSATEDLKLGNVSLLVLIKF
jgi:hypothetical protein